MSSPTRARFLLPGEVPSTPSSSSSPSTTSTLSLSSRTHRYEELPPEFKLHRLLRTSQTPIADNIMSYILWDFRQDPLEAAHYVERLGTPLSQETLNEFATEPPMPYLRVVCEIPEPWDVVVCPSGVRARSAGSAGSRNTFPVYRPTPLTHGRSSSASVSRPPLHLDIAPPPTPAMRPIPLPSSTPPPLPSFTTSPIINFHPVTIPSPPQPQAQPQAQPSREIGVTIADVLSAIYNELIQPILTVEFASLRDNQRIRVQAACDNRTVLSPTSPATATFPPVFSSPSTSSAVTNAMSTSSALSSGGPIPGMKKVDLLLKNTWFAGLSVASDHKNTIRLSLRSPLPN